MSSTALDENPKRSSSSSTRFDAPGLNFKAKLIGLEDVAKSRGHKMCQVAMAKVKAAVLAIGEHKTRITVNVSVEGIKIMDEKAEVVLHHHPVHEVSFISRDANDPRAFGYVFNGENGGHQFVGIKTEKAAEPLVMTLRDLFQTMVELKQEREREAAKSKANVKTSENEIKEENEKNQTDETQDDEKTHPSSTMDLLGFDSGPEQINDIQQLDPLASGTSSTFSAWHGNNQPQATLSGSGSRPQMPGIAMASTVYHQHQTYHQSIPRMQNSALGFHHSNTFPVQTWPRTPTQAPVSLRTEAQPPKPGWTLLDPSTPTSGGSASGLLQPTSVNALVADDQLPPSKYPDPFADLAIIPPQGQHRPGRKASKEDFVKETPKQSLLDISRQQKQQQPIGTPGSTRHHDPYSAAGVSPLRTRELYNTLADGQNPPSDITHHPASPPPHTTLDAKSPVASFQGHDGKVDHDPATPGSSTSRPRPRGSAAPKPGSLVPLPTKVNPKLLCTCALEELHAKKYSRNTIIDTKLFNKCTSSCTNCTSSNRTSRRFLTTIQVKLSQSSSATGNGNVKSNGKSLETEEGGECSKDCEGKSFEDLWSELSNVNEDLVCRLRRDNAWPSPKYSGADESIEAETGHRNSAEMFGTTARLLSIHSVGDESSQDTGLVIRNSSFSETSGEDSGSGSLSSDRIQEESGFPCDVFFGDSFYYYADGEENISADNTDCDSVTGADHAAEDGDTLSDSSSCRKPAPDSRLGSNRRGSARRTRSLSGLVTIREETGSNPDSQTLRQRSRVEATDPATRDTAAWIPYDAQRCHGNVPVSPVDSWAYPGGNPFLDVDPFFDEMASAFLADPLEGQVKGQIVHREVTDLFDVYTETSETFNTRAVTFDF